MIEIKNISKSFRDQESVKHVLDNISITIKKGECIAIIGKSGIGKSVLLKHIIGLVKPDSGKIFIDDVDINAIRFKELQKIRSSIGMVFQFGALLDSMSVEENIGLALNKLSSLSKELIRNKISDSLEAVNMEGSEKLMPSELSGGMKKRIGIARAIAIDPEYLLYDEPTTGLDPITTGKINFLIKKIHNFGNVTSIMVTHELKTVYEVADRVIMLDQKKVIFDGKPDELIHSNKPIIQEFIGNSNITKENND
tara:strand:+ start:268 stop:1026 length:759 start_codon:yes stop_codon:yes gene_type:complete